MCFSLLPCPWTRFLWFPLVGLIILITCDWGQKPLMTHDNKSASSCVCLLSWNVFICGSLCDHAATVASQRIVPCSPSWQSNQSNKKRLAFPGRFAFLKQMLVCWSRCGCALQLVTQCHRLLLYRAHATCTRERRMRFAYVRAVFYLRVVRAPCHGKHPSPIDLTTSWESLIQKYADTVRGAHWKRSCSPPTWQEMRTLKPPKIY